MMMDHTSTITVVNKRLAKLFGYRRTEDLVGKPVTILMAPPVRLSGSSANSACPPMR